MNDVHEKFDEIEDNLATIAEYVEFMDQVTFRGDAQVAFAWIHVEGEAASLAEWRNIFFTRRLWVSRAKNEHQIERADLLSALSFRTMFVVYLDRVQPRTI